MVTKVYESVKAIALCHNVTPTYEDGEADAEETEVDQDQEAKVVYQASSPDEVSRQTYNLKGQYRHDPQGMELEC